MKDFICKKCGNTTYTMQEKLNGTGKALELYCAKCGTWHKWLNKQEKVLYSTHSAEIDYVADSKTEQTITDLLIEFDEMGFAPTTVCPNGEQYAIDWREKVRKEFARLTAENAELRATLSKMETVEKELRERLDKAVELPYTEKGKEYTKIVYKNEFGDIDDETYFHDCYYGYKNDMRGDKYAEARLKELKGGKQ